MGGGGVKWEAMWCLGGAVIVDKAYEQEVKSLEDRGIPCVLPEFLAEHLFEVSVDLTFIP